MKGETLWGGGGAKTPHKVIWTNTSNTCIERNEIIEILIYVIRKHVGMIVLVLLLVIS